MKTLIDTRTHLYISKMLLIIFSDNDINDKDTLDLIKIVAILYSTRAFAGTDTRM